MVTSKPGVESAGLVNFGNEHTPNHEGGTIVSFDDRALPTDQKYRFDVEVTDNGTKYLAKVRWTTTAAPDHYIAPQIPLGLHRIVWSMLDSCEDKFVKENIVELRDCSKPKMLCTSNMTVALTRAAKVTVKAEAMLRAATDNCTPFDQLAISLRREGTGTGMPLVNGQPVSQLTFNCVHLGNNPVEVWIADKSGNMEFCKMTVTVTDPIDACSPKVTGPANNRSDSEQGDSNDQFQLYQNQPNPFEDQTTVRFYLPEAASATFTLFDESGRMLYTEQGDYAKGDNSITLTALELQGASGTLYYRLTTATDSATRKMILMKK